MKLIHILECLGNYVVVESSTNLTKIQSVQNRCLLKV